MNTRSAGLAAIAATLVAMTFANSSLAQTRADRPGAKASPHRTAASQQHHRQISRHSRYYGRYYSEPAFAYQPPVFPPRYRGFADPSFDPNGLPYPRPNYWGDCVIDEGYGRWSACSNR